MISRVFFVIFAIATFDHSAALADESCAPIDVTLPGEALAGVQPSNQLQDGGLGDCYAHSASMIATAFLHQKTSTHSRHSTSAQSIYAYVNGGEGGWVNDANTGRTCNALKAVAKIGSCDRNTLLDRMRNPKNQKALKAGFFDNSEAGGADLWNKFLKDRFKDLHQKKNVCDGFDVSPIINLPPGFVSGNSEMAEAIKNNHFDQFVAKVTEQACKSEGMVYFGKDDVPPMPACENFGFKLPKDADGSQTLAEPVEFKNKIQSLLSRTKLPVGIEYCRESLLNNGSFITNRNFRADLNYLNTDEASDNFSKKCGFHASIVVGQTAVKGTCYFVIQDSDLPCGSFNAAESQGKDHRCDSKKRYLVPVDELSKNTFRVSHIE